MKYVNKKPFNLFDAIVSATGYYYIKYNKDEENLSLWSCIHTSPDVN